jgi:large subunit ribosomal protein L22
MIYRAKHRYADTGARKMRPLAAMIRGMSVDEAMQALQFLPNRGARLIEAVVSSAAGNAEDQGAAAPENLVVTECRIDDGPMFKRIRPRARGTAFGIKRRLAHIIVTLTDVEALEAQSGTPSLPALPEISVPTPTAASPVAPTLNAGTPPAPTTTPETPPATN